MEKEQDPENRKIVNEVVFCVFPLLSSRFTSLHWKKAKLNKQNFHFIIIIIKPKGSDDGGEGAVRKQAAEDPEAESNLRTYYLHSRIHRCVQVFRELPLGPSVIPKGRQWKRTKLIRITSEHAWILY